LHCHDWQAGLVPVLLREDYARRPGYEQLRILFTIHNIAYQGTFPAEMLPMTGLGWHLFNYEQLEFFGLLNFLKAGIVFSDRITTVSPRYAQEIQTPYYGAGLHTALLQCCNRLSGIVNGVDYTVWDPAHDRHLAANYNPESIAQKKPLCKQALQKRMGLPVRPDVPLLGMISRLVDQKGLDLLSRAADSMLQTGDMQWVILGEGEPYYHQVLEELQARYPDQLGLFLGFDECLAHQIEAGADIYLMPSQYEPSGLNQLYSLRYGTVPVVRTTGGLADTIVDCTPETLAAGTATGFRFLAYTPAAFLEALGRALALFLGDRAAWLKLVRTGMQQDWSWDRSAREYNQLYARLEEE
jgi:starch synthase